MRCETINLTILEEVPSARTDALATPSFIFMRWAAGFFWFFFAALMGLNLPWVEIFLHTNSGWVLYWILSSISTPFGSFCRSPHRDGVQGLGEGRRSPNGDLGGHGEWERGHQEAGFIRHPVHPSVCRSRQSWSVPTCLFVDTRRSFPQKKKTQTWNRQRGPVSFLCLLCP